jgi:GcrA cell cycle regulator
MNFGPSIWTPERDDELRPLWQAGLSGEEIAKRMGLTKNQVIGRAHRIGLAGRPSPIPNHLNHLRGSSATPSPSGKCLYIKADVAKYFAAGLDFDSIICGKPCRGSWCAEHRRVVFVKAHLEIEEAA